jgi:ABC-2 type transport system permease protein
VIARRALAFLKRDLAMELSYRAAFFMRLGASFLSLATFYFVSKVIGSAANPYLAAYGGDYFSYVLIGLALVGFQSVGMGAFTSAISGGAAQGTLEAMLVTPTGLSTIVFSSSVWDFLMTALNVAIYLLFGAFVFGVDLGSANMLTALVVLLLTALVFSGIGVLSASVVLVLKRGDPIAWLFGTVSSFAGGMLFPVDVLPGWLQSAARAFPIFYSLKAMRLAVLKGASLGDVGTEVLALTVFAAVLLPVATVAFKRAVLVAKTDGTLGTY